MLTKVMSILVLAFFITGLSLAQGGKSEGRKSQAARIEARSVTMQGYVVDASCAKRMAGKETTMKKAAAHTQDCALGKDCAASGYGVFSGGKYYKFDAAGDKKAKEMIEKSSRESGLAFEVKGKLSGDKLTVASLKEITLANVEKNAEGTEEHK